MSARSVRRVEEVRVYANEFVTVYDDEVDFGEGRAGRHVRIAPTAPGEGVVLLPTCAERVALVRTYRYPLGEWQWALPRGFSQSTDVLTTARAELEEELGATDVDDLSVIGTIAPDSGLMSSRIRVVHAVLAQPVAKPLDIDEVAQVDWVDLDQLRAMIAAEELIDGFTLAALAIAHARGLIRL
jgi:8-oxo-dGTP pyrophosphatase MutT (NUDIX family)